MSRIPRITTGNGKPLALPSTKKQTGLLEGIEEVVKLPPPEEKKALPPASSKVPALPAPEEKKKTTTKKTTTKKVVVKKDEPVLVIAPTFKTIKTSNMDGQYSMERPVQTVREFGLFEDFVGSGRPDPFFL